MPSELEWYREVERRGLLNKLSQDKQDWWNEVKRRGLDKQEPSTEETTSTEQEPKQTTEEYSGPNALQGTARSFATRATAGLAPYIAGATEVGARSFGNLVAGLLDVNPSQLRKAFVPTFSEIKEAYKGGKEEYISSQKEFKEERPKLAAAGEFAGEITGLVAAAPVGGVAGAGAKALQLGSRARLLGAPRVLSSAIRSGAPRVASAAGTFSAYRGVEGLANEGEGLSPAQATTEALKGSLEGTAYSMITGGTYAMLESPLLTKAAEMTGILGKITRTGIRAGAATAEGAAVATVASEISRGELPTKEEVAGGALAVGGIRAVGGAWQGARRSIGKLADYTPSEKAEMARRSEEIDIAKQKADEALAEEIGFTRETRALEQQGASREAIKEAQANEDWAAAYRSEADKQLEQTLRGKPRVQKIVLPESNEQIVSTIKKESGGKISDDVANVLANGRQKKVAMAQTIESNKDKLGTVERVRRFIGKGLRKIGDTLDRYAPLERTGGNSAFILRQRDRGGETSVRQKKLVDSLEIAQKEDKLFVEKLDNYLEAKKNTDMLPKEIDNLKAKNKDGKLDDIIANQERKLLDSQNRVNAFEANEPRVIEEAKKHWEYAQEQLDKLYSEGRLSEDFYNKLKGNPHYIHSEAILDDVSDGLSATEHDILNKQTGLNSAFKKYGAYEGMRGNMLISNLAQGKKIDYMINTQRSMKSWLERALKNGEAQPAKGFENLKEGQYPKGYNPEHQIFVWKDGKANVYDVPTNVAKAYNHIRRDEGNILRFLRLSNNTFKLGTTGIATGFAAMNFVRDIQSVMAGSRSGQFFRPSYVKRAAELYGPTSNNLTTAQKKLKDEIDKKLGPTFSLADTQMQINRDEISRIDRMLQAQNNANEEGSFAKTAMSLLMKGLSTLKAPAEKTFQSGAKALSALGNWSEKIGRATVFQTELRKFAGSEAVFNRWIETGNIPKYALDGAGKAMNEVTLDFNRKMAPLIDDLNRYALPYFKPSLLGAQRLDKVLSDPEIAPIAWRWISNVGALQALINSEIDDKKREKLQSQFNTEMAAKNLAFVDNKGNIQMIPANQEFGPWYKLASIPAELLLNKIKDRKQREDIQDEVTSAIKELSANAIPGGYLFNASNFVPTPIGKMIYEEWTNMDSYSKTPIETSSMLRKEKEERFSATTPKVYRLMSKYLKVGNLQSSPKVWEHRAKKIGSTFAKEMADLGDVVLDYFNIGADEWNLPKRIEEGALLGRFYNRDYTAYARNVQKYDEEVKPLEQAYNSIQKGGKVGNEEQKKKARLYQSIRGMEQQRANLISANQNILSNLRREGQKKYVEYKKRSDKEQAWKEFEKEKEISSINAARKYYANQKKISDLTDKMLKIVKKKKQEQGIK